LLGTASDESSQGGGCLFCRRTSFLEELLRS